MSKRIGVMSKGVGVCTSEYILGHIQKGRRYIQESRGYVQSVRGYVQMSRDYDQEGRSYLLADRGLL